MGDYTAADAGNVQNQALDAELATAGMRATPHNRANTINIVGNQLFRNEVQVGEIDTTSNIITIY